MQIDDEEYKIIGATDDIMELLRRNEENNICSVCGKSGFFKHELLKHRRENHPEEMKKKLDDAMRKPKYRGFLVKNEGRNNCSSIVCEGVKS